MILPPKLSDLRAGEQLIAGMGVSTILADFDFETYSPAGFVWNPQRNAWNAPVGANKKGLFAVGAAVYTEHPDAEVLSLAYDLKDGKGTRLWIPGDPPLDLCTHILDGGLLEAWNVTFESWVWDNICVPKYGFPPLPHSQLRCAMSKARAHALPGSLDMAGKILDITNKKDKDGSRLLNKFSIPRTPTNRDDRLRIFLQDDPEDAEKLYQYNLKDILAEAEASSLIPDLSADELEFWQCDQAINRRGVQIDQKSVNNCISIINQAYTKYNLKLTQLTNGDVQTGAKIPAIKKWLKEQGIEVASLNAAALAELLANVDLPSGVRSVLEIRDLIGSAAVKKLYAMQRLSVKSGRVHDLFIYHTARTGRASGAAIQPQNLPRSGPSIEKCDICDKWSSSSDFCFICRWCGKYYGEDLPKLWNHEWNYSAVEDALSVINSGSLELLEYYFGDAVATVSGCLRGMFIAAPGHDLLCSDYSAIEAVVLAALAGEEWRMEVFRTHGKIYEMSASKITGVPFEDFEKYYQKHDKQHHPLRGKVGKVAELAGGFGGGVGAWRQFGADSFFPDEQNLKDAIKAWRKASPAIVEMWGGQYRYGREECFGLEGMAILAVQNPGIEFSHRGITYLKRGDVLYCRLLSGRYITYHRPRLEINRKFEWSNGYSLSFEGWNTNPKQGATGWIRMHTFGGKLTENVVQATARDILAHAIVNLEKAGYPVVLHVHDEIVSEVKENTGTLQEFEKIMMIMPQWAENWPIKAKGGWRGKRYRKG